MTQHPALAEGRVAVITGGASGIGFAAAKRFAALGMKICLADLSEEALDRAGKQLSGTTVLTVPTDVSRLEDVQRLKDRAYDAFGEVAVLMNNAGVSAGGGPELRLDEPNAESREGQSETELQARRDAAG
jgi:NAD(P)-dependent dehydrogenase (short-subunit alcohol dehydrogenase family)